MNLIHKILDQWGLEGKQQHRIFFVISILVIIALVSSCIITMILTYDLMSFLKWVGDVAQGIGTEMAGALMAFILVERLMDKHRETRHDEEQKQRVKNDQRNLLVYDIIGGSSSQAVRAIEILRKNQWLYDGTLENQNLHNARLNHTDLSGANLKNTWLIQAQLSGTNLYQANLHQANLSTADLEGAILDSTDFSGANLRKSRLRNAKITGDLFDTTSILPDGSSWTAQTDISKFVDLNHPNYYDPCVYDSDLWYCEKK